MHPIRTLLTTGIFLQCTWECTATTLVFPYTEAIAPMPGEVTLADNFTIRDEKVKQWIYHDLSHEMAYRHLVLHNWLKHPDNEDLFYILAQCNPGNVDAVDAYMKYFCPQEQREIARPLIEYRSLLNGKTIILRHEQAPRRAFITEMHKMLSAPPNATHRYYTIMRWLAHDEELSMFELKLLDKALQLWCYGQGRDKIYAAGMRIQLQQFRGDRPVIINKKTEEEMAATNDFYMLFMHAEKALQGQACRFKPKSADATTALMLTMIWRDTAAAVALGRKLGNPGFELLTLHPDTLKNYLRFKGITHYRKIGQDVPEACLAALGVHDYSSRQEAEKAVRNALSALPENLRALAPRCILAVGNGSCAWQAVEVTAKGVSPHWPDTSAVELPMWSPALLGIADEREETIRHAFDADLQALEKHISQVRSVGSAGIILANALQECERTRPEQNDLTLPVYLRIAMHCEDDGVMLDFTDSGLSIRQNSAEGTDSPIINEALCKIPQHLHRIALQLAVWEKHGNNAGMQQACAALAKLLNAHDLWPLLICQRELRGFSPQALLSLFEHYEGEKAPLTDYGEALGLQDEMQIACLGHEDELGRNLKRAAIISKALPATPEQRAEAIRAFMSMAKENAKTPENGLTGSILMHLAKWGAAAEITAWADCPPQFMSGKYSFVGLQLIRHLLSKGQQEQAERILDNMAKHAETDTTPAYREALALAEPDKAKAARLRKDALLLAMLHRPVAYDAYRAYLQDQAQNGTQYINMMKSELLHTRGRDSGITPQLALRFAKEGRWQEAAFAYEYLLTIGISTATPYGEIPDHAHIYYYRALADLCRSKISKDAAALQQAYDKLRGSKMEAIARSLMQQTDTPAVQNTEKPRPPASDPLAALPPREWQLTDGSTVHGQLISVHSSYPNGLRIRLEDGTTRIIPRGQSQESPEAYIQKWEQANNFRTWQWQRHPNDAHAVLSSARGRLLKAIPETDKNFPDDFILCMIKADGSLKFIRTAKMPEEQRRDALEFARSASNKAQTVPFFSFYW